MKKYVRNLRTLRKRDDGASAVEYGLLVALIAVVIAVTVFALGVSLRDKFSEVDACVASASAGDCAPAP